MTQLDEIKNFIEKRPEVKGAYGYGSGVFKQTGYTGKDRPQIDLILVVDNLKDWHLKNIKLNPKDYSFTGKLYYQHAKEKTLKGSTGITYLSNILENDRVYKYGTIEEKDLTDYLETWESFYLPGRFQKTILPIIEDQEVEQLNQRNREKALFTALLTLPSDKKKLIDVYTQLCGLSYLGDTRMKFAENPRKVLNIVEGSFDEFVHIYGKQNQYFKTNKSDEVIIDYAKLLEDINDLPAALLAYISEVLPQNDIALLSDKILEYFTLLNKRESTKQTMKGLYTNGITRSIKYASAKVMKKIKK